MTRLLFSSWHFYLDQSNGASISSRELLLALTNRVWNVKTFCGAATDFSRPMKIEQILASRRISPKKRVESAENPPFSATFFRDAGIDSVVFEPQDDAKIPSRPVGEAFLQLFAETLRRTKPDIVATYGGYWIGGRMLEIAKKNNAKTVVLLQNFAYNDAKYFNDADLIIVPSQYAADVYRKRLGIETVPIPPLVRWENVKPNNAPDSKKYVLFVNPDRNKGVFVFAKIAEEMEKIRSEIPFLVVEGSRAAQDLTKIDVDWRKMRSINVLRNTTKPRDFYRAAKITVVPSLVEESFGRVAAESLIAGVPVVASNRGALPETLGDAGILLDIPAEYRPNSAKIPTSDEIFPWIRAICQLWDEPERYSKWQNRGFARAERWNFEKIAD